ncbi:DUF885 family protein [Shewanella sp. NIFS-20-20]|uniref:DUF885 domain-containing protein n=1 Tax=Shewanella sp. NIFS-20-20 TaxID=2853806 RepID=UPI001C47021A|nr:DUF885 domain-containing protein [Shewanella sp. NIFS-20-20]MBV7315190.1 DUF885 domain-containing protein [Shewanella sp. NIFS-20-20]
MNRTVTLLSVVISLALLGCEKTTQSVSTPSSVSPAVTDKQQVQVSYRALVDAYFDEQLALEPVYATFVGVNDYNHLFTDGLSHEYLTKRHQLNAGYLAKAKAIDRDSLSEQDRLSHDIFVYDREQALVAETFPERFLPLNQFDSQLFLLMQLGSGDSAQPFTSLEQYQQWIARVEGFVLWTSMARDRMNEGIASSVVLPRVLVERMIEQLAVMRSPSVEESVFYQPVLSFPESMTPAQQQQMRDAFQTMISERIYPALATLQQYLTTDYLAASRGTDGWWGLPNGRVWYQHLANQHTTTQMSVDEIHQIGLAEVARILAEMDKVRLQVGFDGDLAAFFDHLSTQPQYFHGTATDLIEGYDSLRLSINQVLPAYFNVQPKADYVVKPVEAFREKSAAGASYQSPAIDGSRPGIFYINTYNLMAQPIWGMTTLSLHEASPGHHFQMTIKQELDDLPDFQRFGIYNAFEEGWALYAEDLGIEMGLFSDPYQYFGKLSDEMLRAMRLVVDTGLHMKGWSREQAIQYMQDNSPMAESDIVAEVERYMAIPGQALSYKVGQLTILQLRQRAQTALGERFDIKAFHDQVLTSGSLPMAVLEQKIDGWIALNLAQSTQTTAMAD